MEMNHSPYQARRFGNSSPLDLSGWLGSGRENASAQDLPGVVAEHMQPFCRHPIRMRPREHAGRSSFGRMEAGSSLEALWKVYRRPLDGRVRPHDLALSSI